MPTTHRYGIFGSAEYTREDDGCIRVLAIIEESGLFAGRPPEELRIRHILPLSDTDLANRVLDDMNKHTDLPFSLGEVEVKFKKFIRIGERNVPSIRKPGEAAPQELGSGDVQP